ncbi:MAG: 50S ribosomal protein L25 [Bacteriovoracaceae bacterium]|nr:50S ribosomal protein L25 [Bacteriovoracaceae bacterium]
MQTLVKASKRSHNESTIYQMRTKGLIPGVLYGSNEPSQEILFKTADFEKALLENNMLYLLNIDDQKNLSIIKEIQSHPITGKFIHVSFQRVDKNKEVEVVVTLHHKGKHVGEKKGAIIIQMAQSIHIKCLPDHIPHDITIDVSHLDVNQDIKVKDIILPANVRLGHEDAEKEVIVCKYPQVQKEATPAPVAAAATATAAPADAKGAKVEPKKDEKKDDKKADKK